MFQLPIQLHRHRSFRRKSTLVSRKDDQFDDLPEPVTYVSLNYPALEIRMSKFITRLTLAVILVGTVGCQSKPDTAATSKALAQYLKAEVQDSKFEHFQITGPTNVRIGDYQELLGGWPVFAEYDLRYTVDGVRVTNRNDGKGTAVAYVKRSGGRTVCFKPDVFADAEADMKEGLEQMMKEINFEK